MAAQVTIPEEHPAKATEAAVAAKVADARDEAIRLIEQQASDSESAVEDAGSPPVETASAADSDAEEKAEAKPEPKPEDERVAKRIAVAKKLEQRSAREREEIRSARAQLDAEKAAIEAERKSLEEIASRYKLLEEDPIKAFEVLKLEPKTFLERLAGEHDPNALVTKKLTELEKQLHAEREERQRILMETQRREQEAHFRAAQESSTRAFVDHVATNADRYPHLTDEFTPEEIAQRGWQVATQHAEAYRRQFGEYPDDEVIADYLEAQAKTRAESRTAWKARLKKPSEPSQGTASASALKPRTLTNGTSSTKASAPKPWNEREAREDAIRIINQLHATRVSSD